MATDISKNSATFLNFQQQPIYHNYYFFFNLINTESISTIFFFGINFQYKSPKTFLGKSSKYVQPFIQNRFDVIFNFETHGHT